MTQGAVSNQGGVAIVLSGAGARGAYEAGALSVLLPYMKGDDHPVMVLGTSVGALNTAMLAAHLDKGVDAAAVALLDGWRKITPDKVFATPRTSLLGLAARRRQRRAGVAPGLLDTSPLLQTLHQLLPDVHFGSAVTKGTLDAVAVAASSTSASRAVVFLETTRPVPSSGPALDYAATRLGPQHLMASAAFPLAFPAQWVDGVAGGWYVDGGIHLNTPLKPAIDLGADRILVLGGTPLSLSQSPKRSNPPNVMDGSAQILHSLLVDSFRADLAAMVRTNLHLGAKAPASGSRSPGAPSGHRLVHYCALNPQNDDLSNVAAEGWPSGLCALLRSLGGYAALGPLTRQRERPGQFLSYLCFTADFIAEAITSGISDAQQLVRTSGGIPWTTA